MQRRLTLDHLIAERTTGRARAGVRAALQLGLFQLAVPRPRRGARGDRRGRRAGQAEPRPPRRQRRPAPGASARASSCPPTTPPRAPPSATRTRSGSCGCGGTCSAPTRRARCSPPTTSPPSSRCASTRSSPVDLARHPGPPRRATRSSSTAPFDALAHPGYARRRVHAAVARVAARRAARSTRSPASASSTSAPRPGGKTTHLAALMGDEGEIVAVERHRGPRPRAARPRRSGCAPSSVRVVVGDATALRGRRRLRPRPARPAVQRPRDAALAPRPALARDPAADRAARRRAGRAARRGPRGALRPGGRARLLRLHHLPGRGAAAPRPEHRRTSRTRTAPTASILPAMEADSGSPARPAASPGCVRRICPAATAACTACTGSSCARSARLRGARDDRAHVEHCHDRLQPLRRLDARRGLTRRDRPVDPGRRLRPPARAGRGGRRRRRDRHPRRRHGRPLRPAAARWGRSAVEALRDLGAHPRRPPDGRAPERHVADFAKAGRRDDHVHAEATPHVHYALQRDPRGRAAAPALAVNPSTPLERLRARSTSTRRSA